jgi:hypothetical protein
MLTPLKLAYCGTCNPVVTIELATEFKVNPVHVDPKTKAVHPGVVIDMSLDLDDMKASGITAAKYINDKIAKALPNKV